MEFTIKDRILILNEVLPQFDSMDGIIIKMSIAEKLKLSEEEFGNIVQNRLPTGVIEIGYKNMEASLSTKEVTLTDEELFYIKSRVRKIDANGMISVDNIGTYQMVLGASFDDQAYADKWEEIYPTQSV